jgi:hypothetical protein
MLGVPVFALGGVLSFLSILLPFCLLPVLSKGEGAGAGGRGRSRGRRDRIRVKTIGHGVWVRVEPKARGGMVKSVKEGMIGIDGKTVAWRFR